MNFLPKPKPPLLKPKPPLGRQKPRNLAEWLETATWYLVPAASERIRAEIEAHYTEAIKAHLAGGASEPAAQAAALADLGDAHAAARCFHGEYLTKRDTVVIGWCLRYAFCLVVIALGMLLPVITLSLPSLPHLPGYDATTAQAGTMLSLLLTVIIASITAQILAARRTTTVTVRQLLLLYVFFALGVGGLFVMIGDGHGIKPSLNFKDNTVMIAYFAYFVFYFLRLRKKLAFADENDLPPSDPATA